MEFQTDEGLPTQAIVDLSYGSCSDHNATLTHFCLICNEEPGCMKCMLQCLNAHSHEVYHFSDIIYKDSPLMVEIKGNQVLGDNHKALAIESLNTKFENLRKEIDIQIQNIHSSMIDKLEHSFNELDSKCLEEIYSDHFNSYEEQVQRAKEQSKNLKIMKGNPETKGLIQAFKAFREKIFKGETDGKVCDFYTRNVTFYHQQLDLKMEKLKMNILTQLRKIELKPKQIDFRIQPQFTSSLNLGKRIARAFAKLPNGILAVVCSPLEKVLIIDNQTGEVIRKLYLVVPKNTCASCFRLNPLNTRAVIGSQNYMHTFEITSTAITNLSSSAISGTATDACFINAEYLVCSIENTGMLYSTHYIQIFDSGNNLIHTIDFSFTITGLLFYSELSSVYITLTSGELNKIETDDQLKLQESTKTSYQIGENNIGSLSIENNRGFLCSGSAVYEFNPADLSVIKKTELGNCYIHSFFYSSNWNSIFVITSFHLLVRNLVTEKDWTCKFQQKFQNAKLLLVEEYSLILILQQGKNQILQLKF